MAPFAHRLPAGTSARALQMLGFAAGWPRTRMVHGTITAFDDPMRLFAISQSGTRLTAIDHRRAVHLNALLPAAPA